MRELTFTRGRRSVRVELDVAMSSNSGDMLRTALRAGIGLHACPSFMAYGDLVAGRIEPVLADWSLPVYSVFAVYPHRRFLSPKVKVFLEALRTHFGNGTHDPWWPV